MSRPSRLMLIKQQKVGKNLRISRRSLEVPASKISVRIFSESVIVSALARSLYNAVTGDVSLATADKGANSQIISVNSMRRMLTIETFW